MENASESTDEASSMETALNHQEITNTACTTFEWFISGSSSDECL